MDSKRLLKLADKLGITVEHIKELIVENHLLTKLIPKSELKTVNINIKDDKKYIEKTAKALKITEDAVIVTALKAYIDKEEKKHDKVE